MIQEVYQELQDPSIHQALSALKITEFEFEDWILDKGASSHMSSNSTLFSSLQISSGADTVMVGNGTFLSISHIGTVSLQTSSGTIELNNALLVPSL